MTIAISDLREIETKACKAIRLFLLEHKGMIDGYDTCVSGYINAKEYGTIDVHTPEDLRSSEIIQMGRELEDILRGIIGEFALSQGVELLIRSHSQKCLYETTVTVQLSKSRDVMSREYFS